MSNNLIDESIDGIFKTELSARTIFKDLSVLSPHYVPEKLPHRMEHAKSISNILAPVVRDEKPNNLFIYGKTGTGKSCVTRYVARKLNEFIKNSNLPVVAKIIYMNCKIYNTKYQVLKVIAENNSLNDVENNLINAPLRDRPDKKLEGMTPVDLYERIKTVIQDNNINLILVLDEIDQIKKGDDLKDLTYILTRSNDELLKGHVSLIGITNSMKLEKRLDPRSRSTLCEEKMFFKPYNAVELKDILKQRVELGLHEDSIEDSSIGYIAAIVAQQHDGDARYALKILQKSGEITQQKRELKINDAAVESAKESVEKDIVAESISALPEHEKMTLYAIAELSEQGSMQRRLAGVTDGSMFTGEVYDMYQKICQRLKTSPRTMRMISNYLSGLEMQGFITAQLSGKYVRGNTRLIKLGYSPKEIKEIIESGWK
ncbi:MAG: hypothetical protein CVT90_02010 [Candidatus Altiarchaeales archaeon HGW-Altiarchaeales-3]|nr:MAG: hypothetical protein CVT90_02010 [Candidatus Altiarchaeales archaeon HGW-Altiarchaeales-3]